MSQSALLLVAFLVIKSLYLPLNRRHSRYYWKLGIDDRIPLVPVFVIPYLGYFVFVAVSIVILWHTVYIYQLLGSLIASYIIGILFWYLVPNGVRRPVLTGKSVFSKLLGKVYSIDGDTNGFPSAHVFVTFICAYFMSIAYGSYGSIIWITASVITLSTLLTKQHYILDIAGGIVVCFLSIAIVR